MGFPVPEALPWNPLPFMDDYLEELAANEMAKTYRKMVKVGLRFFSDYMATEGIRHPEEVNRMHIVRFQAHLGDLVNPKTGGQYALSYRQKIMAYTKGYFTWLVETENLTDTPWVRIRIGRSPKKPNPLEPDQVVALFSAHKKQAFTMDAFDYHQREVILTLLYSWGLRVHELASINIENVDMRLNQVTVRNKGGGVKDLPYGEVEKTVISRWVRHRARYVQRGEDALLVNRRGVRINTQRIWEIVKLLGERAGVEVNPHRFRDTLGTTMLDHDVPVQIVMKLLGHSNTAQTLAYARVNDPTVTRAHEEVMGPGLRSLLTFDAPGGKTT